MHTCTQVLIVDGTNLQFYTKPSTRAISHAASFKAWLRFLSAATGAEAVIVVFDRKGERQGVKAVRQTAAPQYLQARRKKQGLVHPIAAVLPESDAVQAGEHTPLHAKPAAADSAPQPGLLPEMWSQHTSNDVAAAGAVSADLAAAAVSTAASRYTVKSIGGRSTNKGKDGFAAAAQALGCLVVYGVAGYEADDSIASLVHHLVIKARSPACLSQHLNIMQHLLPAGLGVQWKGLS